MLLALTTYIALMHLMVVINSSLSFNYDKFPRKNIHHGTNKILRMLKQSIMTLMGTCKESQWANEQYTGYMQPFIKKETGNLCHKSNETKQTIMLVPVSLHKFLHVCIHPPTIN